MRIFKYFKRQPSTVRLSAGILTSFVLLVSTFTTLALWAAPDTGAVFVSPTGDDQNDCFTLATPCRTITVAISKAVAGDAVLIASGLYTESFTISKSLTLIGFGAAQPVIQAETLPVPHRVFTITAGVSLSIENLTLDHGNALSETPSYGGAILNSGSLTLTRSTVSNSIGRIYGGGIATFNGTLTLISSTVTGNMVLLNTDYYPKSFGGGMATVSGTTTILYSNIMGNTAEGASYPGITGWGGGVYHSSSVLKIQESHFSANRANIGGGLQTGPPGYPPTLPDSISPAFVNSSLAVAANSAVIDRSTFDQNFAFIGGGIDNSGLMTISHSRIYSNTLTTGSVTPPSCTNLSSGNSKPLIPDSPSAGTAPTYWGGGISNSGWMWLSDSVVNGNCADPDYHADWPYGGYGAYGGGIASFGDGQAALTNVTISGNAAWRGNAIFGTGPANTCCVGTSVFTLTNVTISNNYGPNNGALAKSSFLTLTISLKNTLLANPGGNCAPGFQSLISLGHNLSSDTTCPLAATGDLQNTNPLIGPLRDNGGDTLTNALLPGSPAINAAENNGCPATDQRAVPRPQGAACDIGAYEVRPGIDLFPILYMPLIRR